MFDVEGKIKWNDLAKSLQDIIMRKIGYDDLAKSLKDKLVSSADSAILADVFANGYDGQVLKVITLPKEFCLLMITIEP